MKTSSYSIGKVKQSFEKIFDKKTIKREKPEVKPQTKVLVTFLDEEKEQQSKGKQKNYTRIAGR